MTDVNDCTHDCSTCSANCSSRENNKPQFQPANEFSHIKHVIGIVSGKGGVGKSIVTSMLAVTMQRRDYKCAIMDADITGPSIPKAFGTTGTIYASGDNMVPLKTKTGIKMISVNPLLSSDDSPVVWRGPVIAGTVSQFWTGVLWEDVDYMFIDCPPGTGDVPLTIFQSIKLDGIIIVTTPQDLVSMIVGKAINMANMMNIPILGFVENMSYIKCPDCGKEIEIFGKSKADQIVSEYGIKLLGRIPVDPKLSALVDNGIIELMENDYVDNAADIIEKL